MIDTYTELKNIVDSYWLLVAYRYLLKKEEGINAFFIPEEIINAFKNEGVESREDIWKRIEPSFFEAIRNDEGTSHKPIDITNKEEMRDFVRAARGEKNAHFSSEYMLTTGGIEKAEQQLKGIYGDDIPLKTPLGEALKIRSGGVSESFYDADTEVREIDVMPLDSQNEETTAPAADRIVKLDHNSEPHRESIKKLDELIEEVGEKNEPKYQQAAAHLKAAKALLEAPELREKDRQTIKEWFEWLKREITSAAFQASIDKLLEFLLRLF